MKPSRPLAKVRDAIWERSTRHIPQAVQVPAWAVALRLLLFPQSTLHILARNGHPFDPWTRTWNLYGARFSDAAILAMAGRMPEGHWYRFKRREELGNVICIEEVRDARPDHRFPTPHQIAECGGPCLDGGPSACDCGLNDLR